MGFWLRYGLVVAEYHCPINHDSSRDPATACENTMVIPKAKQLSARKSVKWPTTPNNP